MCLVNSHALLWLSNGSLVSPLELFLRIPPEAIIQKGRWVLNCHAGPRRVSVSPFSIWSFNIDLVLGAVRNSWFSIDSRDRDVEASKVILSCPKFFPIPLVEFAENRNRISTWCPLLVDDVAIWLNVETILLVRSSDIDETALGIFKNLKPFSAFIYSLLEVVLMVLQVRIIINDLEFTSSAISDFNTCGQVISWHLTWWELRWRAHLRRHRAHLSLRRHRVYLSGHRSEICS